MRALLNSLGLTLWSSIAIVLAVALALVGYRVSLSMKDSPATTSLADARVASAPPISFIAVEPSLGSIAASVHGQRVSPAIEPELRAAEAALHAGRWQEVVDDAQAAERRQGVTVFDTKTINHFKAYAHLQLQENDAALTEFERVLATGVATPEETAAISRTVSTLRAHAESDGHMPPPQGAYSAEQEAEPAQREADSSQQESNESLGGNADIRLGQLYYGFGDYQKAVDAIIRGLQKRATAHLDDAYVYLGLAQQKLNNIAEARRAFARLKDVPNINPRISRLWGLYGDALAAQAQTADSPIPKQAGLH